MKCPDCGSTSGFSGGPHKDGKAYTYTCGSCKHKFTVDAKGNAVEAEKPKEPPGA